MCLTKILARTGTKLSCSCRIGVERCRMAALFSIVTPSYRSGRWLKLAIASVSDQKVPHEHIVQDAGSDDDTLAWLPADPRVKAFVEPDQGMYDALNRGFRRTSGDLLAWLNCDEQYLEGALTRVAEWFAQHPDTDVLFGDVVMVDRNGRYLAHRKMQTPLRFHTWTAHLSTLSCATFFRRRVLFEHGCFFNPKLRDVGDGEWMLRLLQRGLRMAALGEFTSAFTQTGANMSAGPNAQREARELHASAPALVRALQPLWVAQHRVRRWLGGMYRQEPFQFSLYTADSPARRQAQQVTAPVAYRGQRSADF